MKLAQVYSKVIKYGLMPKEVFSPYLKSYYDNNLDKSHLYPLADYLQENDDLRGHILSRYLGSTSHPEQKEYANGTGHGQYQPNTYNVDTVYHLNTPSMYEDFTVFSPVAKTAFEEKASGVYVGFNKNYPIKEYSSHSFYAHGIFTPEEARELADKLPEEDAKRTHEMLDRHFGKRQ
jgi:hypothetical protein